MDGKVSTWSQSALCVAAVGSERLWGTVVSSSSEVWGGAMAKNSLGVF